jgi:hypothetical protein
MGEGEESYSHVYCKVTCLEEEDDLVTRSFGLGRSAGGLVGPSWCGPILFFLFLKFFLFLS